MAEDAEGSGHQRSFPVDRVEAEKHLSSQKDAFRYQTWVKKRKIQVQTDKKKDNTIRKNSLVCFAASYF